MPTSKPVGGFDLILGQRYNDFWFNRAEPQHYALPCVKCRGRATWHRLEKLVFAFGKMTVKNCDIATCPDCLHEWLLSHTEAPKKPATKRNLAKLFAKLPKAIQQQILGGTRGA